jgi:hypothetical protein
MQVDDYNEYVNTAQAMRDRAQHLSTLPITQGGLSCWAVFCISPRMPSRNDTGRWNNITTLESFVEGGEEGFTLRGMPVTIDHSMSPEAVCGIVTDAVVGPNRTGFLIGKITQQAERIITCDSYTPPMCSIQMARTKGTDRTSFIEVSLVVDGDPKINKTFVQVYGHRKPSPADLANTPFSKITKSIKDSPYLYFNSTPRLNKDSLIAEMDTSKEDQKKKEPSEAHETKPAAAATAAGGADAKNKDASSDEKKKKSIDVTANAATIMEKWNTVVIPEDLDRQKAVADGYRNAPDLLKIDPDIGQQVINCLYVLHTNGMTARKEHKDLTERCQDLERQLELSRNSVATENSVPQQTDLQQKCSDLEKQIEALKNATAPPSQKKPSKRRVEIAKFSLKGKRGVCTDEHQVKELELMWKTLEECENEEMLDQTTDLYLKSMVPRDDIQTVANAVAQQNSAPRPQTAVDKKIESMKRDFIRAGIDESTTSMYNIARSKDASTEHARRMGFSDEAIQQSRGERTVQFESSVPKRAHVAEMSSFTSFLDEIGSGSVIPKPQIPSF